MAWLGRIDTPADEVDRRGGGGIGGGASHNRAGTGSIAPLALGGFAGDLHFDRLALCEIDFAEGLPARRGIAVPGFDLEGKSSTREALLPHVCRRRPDRQLGWT